MNRTIKYDIPKEFSGKTIEQFLRRKGYTNSGIVQLKKDAQKYFSGWYLEEDEGCVECWTTISGLH